VLLVEVIGGEQGLIRSRRNRAVQVPQPRTWYHTKDIGGSFTECVNKRENKSEIRVVVKPVRLIWFIGKKRLVCVREDRGDLKGPKKPNTNDNQYFPGLAH